MRGQELLTFVIYDIVDDLVRGRVANACKDYGLERIQYSAFCGSLAGADERTRLLQTLAFLGPLTTGRAGGAIWRARTSGSRAPVVRRCAAPSAAEVDRTQRRSDGTVSLGESILVLRDGGATDAVGTVTAACTGPPAA